MEQGIINQAVRFNARIPDRIANAPVLREGLDLYLDAFFILDSERYGGGSILPIPFSAIVNYAILYDLSEDQREDLIYFVRRMDSAHIKRQLDKSSNG